jgi:hypothetical protein
MTVQGELRRNVALVGASVKILPHGALIVEGMKHGDGCVNEITQRYCIAVERSFAFLVSDFGFRYGGCRLIDADGSWEQTVVGRLFKGARRIEVRMNIIALTVAVFSSRFATVTDCLRDAVLYRCIESGDKASQY